MKTPAPIFDTVMVSIQTLDCSSGKFSDLGQSIKQIPKIFYSHTKTEISILCYILSWNIYLYLPKMEIAKKWFYTFIKKKHQSVFAFLRFRITSSTEGAFVFHLQEDFYIVCNHNCKKCLQFFYRFFKFNFDIDNLWDYDLCKSLNVDIFMNCPKSLKIT